MVKKCDLSDFFQCGVAVGARWAVLIISKADEMLEYYILILQRMVRKHKTGYNLHCNSQLDNFLLQHSDSRFRICYESMKSFYLFRQLIVTLSIIYTPQRE